MSRFKHLTIALLACALFAATPMSIATAQQTGQNGAPTVDIPALESALLTTTGASLSDQLWKTPPTALPAGFSNAISTNTGEDPNAPDTRAQRGVLPLSTIPELGQSIDMNVVYSVEGAPNVLGGTTNTSTLSFVIFTPGALAEAELAEEEADDTDDDELSNTMDFIEDGIEDGFGDEPFADVDVTRISDGNYEALAQDVDALYASYAISEGRSRASTELYVVQIGTVFIFSLVALGDDGTATQGNQANPAPAESLAVAGIQHLNNAVAALASPE